jgi:hypothetical protein
MFADEGKDFPHLESRVINYIITVVKEQATPKATSQLLGKVLDTSVSNGGVIETVTASLVSIVLDLVESVKDAEEKRLALVNELMSKYGSDIALIHGKCACSVGIVGSKTRMNYTALIPDYKQKIKSLSGLDYGEYLEV